MKTLTSIGLVLGALTLITILGTWPVMMGLEVLHEHWRGIPALSFWDTFWVLWAWGVIWRATKTG